MDNFEKLTEEIFFKIWKEICNADERLSVNWNYSKKYTGCILANCTCSIINKIAEKFGKKTYLEYYGLDAVFYDEDDFINPQCNDESRKEYWLKRIQLAFEHENDPRSTYQEISHLLTTNAKARVLVTYSDRKNVEDLKNFAQERADLMKDVKGEKILLIVGYMEKEINWKGYILKDGEVETL